MNLLDHVFRDSVDLLSWVEVLNGVKVKSTITLDEARTDAFQFLVLFRSRPSIVFCPNKVQHSFDTNLESTRIYFSAGA